MQNDCSPMLKFVWTTRFLLNLLHLNYLIIPFTDWKFSAITVQFIIISYPSHAWDSALRSYFEIQSLTSYWSFCTFLFSRGFPAHIPVALMVSAKHPPKVKRGKRLALTIKPMFSYSPQLHMYSERRYMVLTMSENYEIRRKNSIHRYRYLIYPHQTALHRTVPSHHGLQKCQFHRLSVIAPSFHAQSLTHSAYFPLFSTFVCTSTKLINKLKAPVHPNYCSQIDSHLLDHR